MSSCEQDLSDDGHQEISMQNRHVRLSILPDAGGKITEIVDRRSGRNWLWRNPHIPCKPAVYGADYGRHLDSGGWDEILLSIAPVDLHFQDGPACHIPDHGDVVGRRWSVVDAGVNGAGDAVCEMAVCGRALQYEFRRTVRLRSDSSCLEMRYSLTNEEAFAWPWYWSAHAMLTGQRDLRIELPAQQHFRIDHSVKNIAGSEGHTLAWPRCPLQDGVSFDLSRCFEEQTAAAAFAGKIFVRSPDRGLVSVAAAGSSERLSIRYDPGELPWLGLWINNGGWSGCDSDPYFNLGLEPTTAAFDSVCHAIDDGAISWLEPGETRNWAIAVELHA